MKVTQIIKKLTLQIIDNREYTIRQKCNDKTKSLAYTTRKFSQNSLKGFSCGR